MELKVSHGPTTRPDSPAAAARHPARAASWQVLVLIFLTLAIHSAGLFRGRILDDFFVLDKCQERSITALLTGGLTISREEAGNFWWIEQDTLLSYFRPLLLITYKLPALLSAHPDFWQHLVNLLLHLATVLLLFKVARRVTRDERSAFIATLLFAAATQNLMPAQWISGRKEILVGLLLLLAFMFHVSRRRGRASLAFAAALFSAEQAAVFPVMAVIWDRVSGAPSAGEGARARPIRDHLPAWLAYVATLGAYLAVRAVAFRGGDLPAPPYYTSPLAAGFVPQTLFKFLHFLFSLTTTAPYVDRVLIHAWIDTPLLLAACLVVIAAVLVAVLAADRGRRTSLALLALAVVSALPFLSMAALPFYMYTPAMFCALAVGVALRPDPQSTAPLRIPAAKLTLLCWVLVLVPINVVAGMALSWSPISEHVKLKSDVLYGTARLMEGLPRDRNVLLVGIPAEFPYAFFQYPKRLAELTGRSEQSFAIVCDRPGGSDRSTLEVTPLGPDGFAIRSVGRPFFHMPGGRLLWLFPEGIITPGRTFVRPWYSVTIKDAAPAGRLFTRGPRFYSRDEGVTALEVRVPNGVLPPVVIGFKDRQPYVLVDLLADPHMVVPPPMPAAGQAERLLRALGGAKGSPPRVLRMPDRLIPVAGPRMGLGPLLAEMSGSVPAFGRAYVEFLRYLDDLNTRIARAGGGAFRMSASNPGHEQYAGAIEAVGGMSRVTMKGNALGVTWDSVMETARGFADASLARQGVDAADPERLLLVNLLALGQIAAVTNQVIPAEYEAEWESRHPERPRPQEAPPAGIRRGIWDGVRQSLPYMYHAGVLPWRDAAADNPLEAFDTDHFFSHAWMVCYSLFRHERYRPGVFGGGNSRRYAGRAAVEQNLAWSDAAGFGYEALSLIIGSGFLERTRVAYLPGFTPRVGRFFGIEALPFVESFRDLRVGHEGAVYGAALAISGWPLKPSDGRTHRRIVDGL